MRRPTLIVAAIFCVIALIITGLVVIPKVADIRHKAECYDQLGLPAEPNMPPIDQWYTIEPGNWWRQELNQQQLQVLHDLWGRQINIKQLLLKVWPEVLDQIPPEFATPLTNDITPVLWPMEFEGGITLTMEEALAKGIGAQGGGRTIEGSTPASDVPYMDYYIGTRKDEPLPHSWEGDIPQEMFYRISLYV